MRQRRRLASAFEIKPPDINESDEAFTVVYSQATRQRRNEATRHRDAGAAVRTDEAGAAGKIRGEIRFGLAAISGVGHKAVQAILDARRDGEPFKDIYEFCERVDLSAVNRAVMEALIKSGAFDSTGAMRRALVQVLDNAIELGQQVQRDKKAGQLDMFGSFTAAAPPPAPPIPSIEWSDSEMLAYEKATLGFYITKHPLTQYEDLIRAFSTHDVAAIRAGARVSNGNGDNRRGGGGGMKVVLGGVISKVRTTAIRNGPNAGKKLLIAVIEDLVGSMEAVVFPEQVANAQTLLKPDAVVFIEGTIDSRREEPSLRVSRVIPIETARRELSRRVLVQLRSPGDPAQTLPGLRDLCQSHRGECELIIQVSSPEGWVTTIKPRARGLAAVDPCDELLEQLEALIGVESVRCAGARDPR